MRLDLKELITRPTLEVARGLLGCKLTTWVRGKETSGMIVETEAYHGDNDEASHAFIGPTARNKVMFCEPGRAYVYFIYGMHYCVNVTTEAPGTGAAVLVRALQPLTGIETMKRRRHLKIDKGLTDGPGKLCQALGIDKRMTNEDLLQSNRIRLEPFETLPAEAIVVSTRIGIAKSEHLPWRFFISGNPYVSRK